MKKIIITLVCMLIGSLSISAPLTKIFWENCKAECAKNSEYSTTDSPSERCELYLAFIEAQNSKLDSNSIPPKDVNNELLKVCPITIKQLTTWK